MELLSLLLLTVLSVKGQLTLADSACSAYNYPGNNDADIKLAAILCFQPSVNGKCNGTYYETTVKQAIALNIAVELLNGKNNGNDSFIPKVRFGIDIYDDCCSEYLAARHAGDIVSYIKGNEEYRYGSTTLQSNTPIAGILGTSISQTTTVVANLLALTNVPLIGISATLSELSNKTKYPAFVRAVPSELKLAQVILELSKKYHWSYVIGVHTDDNYGVEGMKEVKRLAAENLICISWVEVFSFSMKLTESQMELFIRITVANALTKTSDALGIVYFGNNKPFIQLLEYVTLKKSLLPDLNRIYWIATDAVSGTQELAQLIYEFGTNIIILDPPEFRINTLEDRYFQILEDPPDWITGQWKKAIGYVMTNTYKCPGYNFTKASLQGCDIRKYSNSDGYMAATLDSVYLLANTLREIHTSNCSNEPRICQKFQEILQTGILKTTAIKKFNYSSINQRYRPSEFDDRYLISVDNDFEAMGQSKIIYSVKANNNNGFSQIGTYREGKLVINESYASLMKTSQCKSQCTECLDIGQFDYLYSHGSPVLIGLFSIHWPSTTDRFGCGNYRNESLNYMEIVAFMSTVSHLRSTTNISYGYLVIDDCYNSFRVTRMLSKIFSGDMTIIDRNTLDVFNKNNAVVLIGAQSSIVTLAILPFLNGLGIPVISYSATNPTLIDKVRYPYFSRTCSSDVLQARAIVDILKKLKVTYVGVVVYKNLYGLDLYNHLRTLAEKENICVDEAYQMNENTTITETSIQMKKYRNSFTNVIVVLAMDQIIRTLLDSATYQDTFTFIGSESWGIDLSLAGNRGERARGSLVLGLPVDFNVDAILRKELSKMDPFSITKNDWTRDFWQQYFKCNLPGSFNNVYKSWCPEKYQLSDMDMTNLMSPLVVHATMATLSAGQAISSMSEINPIMPYDPAILTKKIRSTTLTYSNGTQFQPFLDSGEGSSGYYIYNIQKRGDIYSYVKVGDYSSNNALNLNKVEFYNDIGEINTTVVSSCLGRSECANFFQCQEYKTTVTPNSSIQPSAGSSDTNSSTQTIVLASVVGVLVFIIIVFVLFVFWKWRHHSSKSKAKTAEQYITADMKRGATNRSSHSSYARPSLPPREAVFSYNCSEISVPSSTYHIVSSKKSDFSGSVDNLSNDSRNKSSSNGSTSSVHMNGVQKNSQLSDHSTITKSTASEMSHVSANKATFYPLKKPTQEVQLLSPSQSFNLNSQEVHPSSTQQWTRQMHSNDASPNTTLQHPACNAGNYYNNSPAASSYPSPAMLLSSSESLQPQAKTPYPTTYKPASHDQAQRSNVDDAPMIHQEIPVHTRPNTVFLPQNQLAAQASPLDPNLAPTQAFTARDEKKSPAKTGVKTKAVVHCPPEITEIDEENEVSLTSNNKPSPTDNMASPHQLTQNSQLMDMTDMLPVPNIPRAEVMLDKPLELDV